VPVADPAFSWPEALAAFAIITVAAFLVTWILTDRLRIPRAPYIPMLLAVTLGLGTGYLAWSGTSASDPLSSGMGWGAPPPPGRPGRPARGRWRSHRSGHPSSASRSARASSYRVTVE
jgi:hypothetical protein